MSIPAHIAHQGASGVGSTASVVIPTSGVAAGQKILVALSILPAVPNADPTSTTDVDDTFTESTNSGGRMYLWEGTITSSGALDPGDTISIALSGTARWSLGLVIAAASAIPVGGVGVYAPSPPIAGNTDGTLTSPGATAADASRVYHIYGTNGDTNGAQPSWTAHASTTERVDTTSNHGSSKNSVLMIADETVAGPGAVAGRTATSTSRVQPTAFTVVLSTVVDRPEVAASVDPASVPSGDTFTLTATPSGGAGAPFTYQWEQTAGTTTALDDDTAAEPTATAGAVSETLTYSVVVTDDDGVESFPDEVNVVIVGESDTATPISDVTTTGWTKEPSGAASFAAVLADISDATYAAKENPAAAVLTVAMSTLTEPVGSEPYTVSYRTSMHDGSDAEVLVELMQGGATVIASWTDDWSVASTVQQFDHELTAEEVGDITDWSDLRLRFTATVT